jgi:hypothetical protein
LLADNRVLLPSTNPALVFDPIREIFLPTAGNSVLSTATLLPSGKVLLTGGWQSGLDPDFDFVPKLFRAELFDERSLTFVPTKDMNLARVLHTVTLLPDGTALVVGGQSDSCTPFPFSCYVLGSLAKAEVYNPLLETFSETGDLVLRREWHQATLLNDGRVLVTGGNVSRGIGAWEGSTSSAEIYTPENAAAPPLVYSLANGQGAVLHAGTARIVSAASPAAPGDYLEIYAAGLLGEALIPPQVTIGGRTAEVLFFGAAPGYPGVFQINVRMPSGVAAGTVPLRMSYLGRFTNKVTIEAR